MALATDDRAARRPGVPASLPRPVAVVVLLTVCSAIGFLAWSAPAAVRALGQGWDRAWEPIAYVLCLALLEQFDVRLPVRGDGFVMSFMDMVVVLGLVFLPPPLFVTATAAGIAISQSLSEFPLVKRLFNVAQIVVSVAVVAFTTSHVVDALDGRHLLGFEIHRGPAGQFNPALAIIYVACMGAYFLTNNSLVSLVVALSTRQRFIAMWLKAAPVAATNWVAGVSYGLVIAALLPRNPALLPLLVMPVVFTIIGNRAWAKSLAQGQRTHLLYTAGRALSDQLGDIGRWQTFVQHVAEVLNCEGAAVFLGRLDDNALEVISTSSGFDRLVVTSSPGAWEQAAKGFATRSGWRGLVLVPLEAEGRTLGYLAGFGPRLNIDFDAADRETLAMLANQAAAALLNEDLFREAEGERAALRDIVAHTTDGIYTVGPDRTVRSWNPAMAALTGYDEEEAVGQKCFNLLRARDGDGVDMCASDCPILAAAQSKHEEERDASVLDKDGRSRWIHYAHAPITGSDGEMDADVVVVRDVTRERQADELKSDFIASVSHELRTPLTPIKGFLLTLLREDRDFSQDSRREYYKLMLTQAQRLERLVEELLEVTRLEAGADLVDAVPIDAVDLVRQTVARHLEEEPERTINITVPDHGVYARGDWMRIDQVLGNLLSNALRYAPAQEPIEVRVIPQSREVIFEVRDRGPGIPVDEQTRIFERFHRGGHYMTRDQGGAGLGLYLAKRLVEAMDGRIWVSSRVGHGSVFSFAVPAEPSLGIVGGKRDRDVG